MTIFQVAEFLGGPRDGEREILRHDVEVVLTVSDISDPPRDLATCMACSQFTWEG